jgi:hypothetical protein
MVRSIRGSTSLVFVGLALLSLEACGGGGGSAPAAGAAQLQGDWFGSQIDDEGRLSETTVRLDENGNIVRISGAPDVRGTTSLVSGQSRIYEFTLSDGTEGGFYVDSSFTYAVFVDEDGFFGVLQKGASSLPDYRNSDVVGRYSGVTVNLDASFSITDVINSSVEVRSSLDFEGDAGGPFTGKFNEANLVYGSYEAEFTDDTGSGRTLAFLSADKTFAGAVSCYDVESFPRNCAFSVWTRN